MALRRDGGGLHGDEQQAHICGGDADSDEGGVRGREFYPDGGRGAAVLLPLGPPGQRAVDNGL